jgi:hypothetical protein
VQLQELALPQAVSPPAAAALPRAPQPQRVPQRPSALGPSSCRALHPAQAFPGSTGLQPRSQEGAQQAGPPCCASTPAPARPATRPAPTPPPPCPHRAPSPPQRSYCECFASGRYCDHCNCISCLNNQENEAVRQSAVETILESNPNAVRRPPPGGLHTRPPPPTPPAPGAPLPSPIVPAPGDPAPPTPNPTCPNLPPHPPPPPPGPRSRPLTATAAAGRATWGATPRAATARSPRASRSTASASRPASSAQQLQVHRLQELRGGRLAARRQQQLAAAAWCATHSALPHAAALHRQHASWAPRLAAWLLAARCASGRALCPGLLPSHAQTAPSHASAQQPPTHPPTRRARRRARRCCAPRTGCTRTR